MSHVAHKCSPYRCNNVKSYGIVGLFLPFNILGFRSGGLFLGLGRATNNFDIFRDFPPDWLAMFLEKQRKYQVLKLCVIFGDIPEIMVMHRCLNEHSKRIANNFLGVGVCELGIRGVSS
jgi:hypothetical protein